MIIQTLTRSALLLTVASTFANCGGGERSVPFSTPVSATPIAPPVSAPAPVAAANTLRGTVFESTAAGRVAVAGVMVYCDSCGSPVGHTFAYTETDGSYSFSWTYDGLVPLQVKKDGYYVVDASRTFADGTGVRNAVVRGDTTFDVELARR